MQVYDWQWWHIFLCLLGTVLMLVFPPLILVIIILWLAWAVLNSL